MAEYIDRDTAIRTAIEMCVKVVGDCITQIDAVEIANAFEDIPAADVVPKSEVDELKADLEVWKQNRFNIYQMLDLYKMTQQEVAREIFEEIERTLDNYHYSSLLVGEIYPISYYDAELEDAIAELKKKYVEESK